MAFLTGDELDSLVIEQSVFHIVGPGKEHFQLLEAFDASPHASFFMGRIKTVVNGNRYTFLPDAAVRTQLARIESNKAAFQEESEKLAMAFDEGHRGSSAIGAFLVFTLRCVTGQLFALIKFEDEKVLSYAFAAGRSGKPMPTFDEIKRTFVQNRNALQKAALVRLGRDADDVCVVDRQNPQRPAAYFEQFLGVRRSRTEGELTKKLIDVTKAIARRHKDKLPPDAVAALSKRLYDASQSGGSVDGEKIADWFKSIVGPLPDDSPVLNDLKKELAREGMAGESFVLDKGAVPAPRNRRVETASGVRLTFPIDLQASVVRVDRDKGEIIITDRITLDDVELEAANRARA
jgi:hypothetical protein